MSPPNKVRSDDRRVWANPPVFCVVLASAQHQPRQQKDAHPCLDEAAVGVDGEEENQLYPVPNAAR